MFFRKQKVAGNDNRVEPATPPEARETTVIAAGTHINGNVESEGDLRIEGTVRGSVRVSKLVLLHDGVIEGDVLADEVAVHGYVKGPLRANHIHLHAGAIVEGDLASATIAIDTGARFSGAVWQEQHPDGSSHKEEAAVPSISRASLWDNGENDAFRPLTVVNPRIGGVSR